MAAIHVSAAIHASAATHVSAIRVGDHAALGVFSWLQVRDFDGFRFLFLVLHFSFLLLDCFLFGLGQ
jgi:hypothetical protein